MVKDDKRIIKGIAKKIGEHETKLKKVCENETKLQYLERLSKTQFVAGIIIGIIMNILYNFIISLF